MTFRMSSDDQVANVLSSIAGTDPYFSAGSPALAFDAAQSNTPDTTATTLAHADQVTNAQDAVQTQQDDSGVWGWVSAHLGHGPVGAALNWVNKPLQEISDDYKFIHAVYTTEGSGAGLLATLGVAGGAAAGFAVGEPIVGGIVAGVAERQVLGRTIWQRAYALSQNPSYQVSFGRDLANLVTRGHASDSIEGTVLSGTADAAFDFALDPLAAAGRAAAGLRSGKTLVTKIGPDGVARTVSNVPLVRSFPAASDFFASRSLHIFSPDQFWAVYHGNPATSAATRISHRAMDDIAKMDSQTVARNYPAFGTAGARKLGDAGTRDEVAQVFANIFGLADSINIINGAAILPSRTLLGAGVSGMRDVVAKWGGDQTRATQANWFIPKRVIKQDTVMGPDGRTVINVGPTDQTKWILPVALGNLRAVPSAAAKTVRTWSERAPFSIEQGGQLVDRRRIDLTNDSAHTALRSMFRMGMSEAMTDEYMKAYIDAVHPTGLPNLGVRRAIIDAGQFEVAKAAGMPDDPVLFEDMRNAFHATANGWTDGSPARAMGYGHDLGDEVSYVDDGTGKWQAALHPWQDAKHVTLLDFYALRKAVNDLHSGTRFLGAGDELYRKAFIESVFKPTALLTGGFAQRVSASELLQTMMRYGAAPTLRAMVAGSAARMGRRLLTVQDDGVDETDEVLANSAYALAGAGTAGKLREPTRDEIQAVIDHATNPDPGDPLAGVPSASEAAANAYGEGVMAKIGRAGFRLANTVDQPLTELAIKLSLRHGGPVANGGVRTGTHGSGWADLDNKGILSEVAWINGRRSARAKGQAYEDGKLAWHPGPNYTVWEPESAQFNMHWLMSQNRAANDLQSRNIVSDVLSHLDQGMDQDAAWRLAVDKDAARIAGYHHDPADPLGYGQSLSPEEDHYAAWRDDMARTGIQSPDLHAYNVADDLRNTVTGRDGTFHDGLARAIASGRKVTLGTIDRIDPLRRPKGIIGPEWEAFSYGNVYKRFVQRGFRYLDAVINAASRSPLYLVATQRELKKLEWFVQNGKIDEERALTIAEHRATHAILPQIHNTANRSQFALGATNLLPFWFAQEQAYRRTARLAGENPAALRYYQIIDNGLVNGGFTTTDANGNKHLSFPGVGAAGQAAVNALSMLGVPLVGGLPISVDGSLQSLQSVLPETNLPGVSPLVAVAANALSNIDPVFSRALGKVVGEQNVHASFIDQIIPNSPLRSLVKGLTAPEGDRAYQSAVLSALQSAYYNGQMPGPNASLAERREFADKIKNNARSTFIIKALLGTVSPLAPQVGFDDGGLRKEYNDLVNKYGDHGVALAEYTRLHGDKALSYTVGQSAPTDAKIPYTADAIAFIEHNQNLVKDYPIAAAMLVPQTGSTGNIQAINDELLKMHLRAARTPEEFMSAVYVAAGNNLLEPSIRAHEKALLGATGNTQATAQENANWSAWLTTQRYANPDWYDSYTSDARRTKALQGLAQLMAVYKNAPEQTTSPHAQQVYGLIRSFMNHTDAQAALHQQGTSSGAISAERTNWTNYLDSVAGYTDPDGTSHHGTNEELATVIRTIFAPLAAQNVDLNLLAQAA